jgi:DNA-binding response OmpR family regulator
VRDVTEERQTRVLVVDDEVELNRVFANWLAESYDVGTAYDGREALDRIDERVDVVLLDRHMPRLDGDRVAAEIRARDLDCRIVMVTGISPEFDVLGIGFDDYVVKPVDRAELLGTVARMEELGRYDAASRRFFALVAKRDTLRAAKSDSELERNEAYGSLLEELESARSNLDAARAGAEAEPGAADEAVFRDPPEWQLSEFT